MGRHIHGSAVQGGVARDEDGHPKGNPMPLAPKMGRKITPCVHSDLLETFSAASPAPTRSVLRIPARDNIDLSIIFKAPMGENLIADSETVDASGRGNLHDDTAKCRLGTIARGEFNPHFAQRSNLIARTAYGIEAPNAIQNGRAVKRVVRHGAAAAP